MDQAPLVREEVEAGARFLAEFAKAFPVRVAFWLPNEDAGRWVLYVASEQFEGGKNFREGLSEVGRIKQAMNDPCLDPFQVKLIGADTPKARAAIDWLRRYPGIKAATPFRQMHLGDTSVDFGYFYPPPTAVA
jgi:hypothetical protein